MSSDLEANYEKVQYVVIESNTSSMKLKCGNYETQNPIIVIPALILLGIPIVVIMAAIIGIIALPIIGIALIVQILSLIYASIRSLIRYCIGANVYQETDSVQMNCLCYEVRIK